MERSNDGSLDRGRRNRDGAPDLSVAIADQPVSMTGAHWANRDNEAIYRKPSRSQPFRRPPAENSFPGSGGPAAPVSPALSSFGPSELDPNDDEAVRRSRHWTTIGTATLRPRTSDRGQAAPPAGDDTGGFFGPDPDEDTEEGFGPPGRGAGRARVGGSPFLASGSGGKAAHVRLKGKAAAEAEDARVAELGGLLGGGGREIRPHRAARRDGHLSDKDTTNTGRGLPAAPRRRRGLLWMVLLSSVLVLLAGSAMLVMKYTGSSAGTGLASILRSGAGSGGKRTVTAPLDGRKQASIDVITGASQVVVTSQDLGNDLYRITSAEDSGMVPRPVVDGDRVQLSLSPDGDGTSGRVEIVLAAKVRWALKFVGGADEHRVNLTGGQLTGLDVVGGAGRVELTLPTPSGTVDVRITGAVDELVVKSPQDSPVRARLDSGTKTAAVGERTLRDVEPGSTFTPRNWDQNNRYDVVVASRLQLLSVEPLG